MDREELKRKLSKFTERLVEMNRPIDDLCLEAAYPSDPTTSYVLKVKINWDDCSDCSPVLDILIDVLWETTSAATRKYIFAIDVHSSGETLDCYSGQINETQGLEIS